MTFTAPRGLSIAIATTLLLGVSSAAHAGIFRAYLSKNGSDANPCTLAQPCRLIPAALAAVNTGGEIWMLDSANYNMDTVTIGKSVTVLAVPGALGSVVGNAGNAISIAGTNVEVTLRNVNVVAIAGPSGTGIAVDGAGSRTTVEKCEVYGFNVGIFMGAEAMLAVVDSTIRNNDVGIVLADGSSTISRTRVLNNLWHGISAMTWWDASITALITDSVTTGNEYGLSVYGDSTTRTAKVVATRTVASGNRGVGYQSWGGFGELTVADSMATANGVGFEKLGSATFRTIGDNFVAGNGTDVLGTLATIPPQ